MLQNLLFFALKIAMSLAAWLVAVLITAAGVEMYFNAPRPGLVSIISMLALAPVLVAIWRIEILRLMQSRSATVGLSMDNNRIFGGNPFLVIVRLVVISIIVGIVMSALNIRPENLVYHLQLIIRRISELGLGIFENAFGYLALGAVVVVPIWLVMRLLGATRRERP